MFNINNKTIKDIQWSFIGLIIPSLAYFVLRIIIGRKIGPKGLGLYTLLFTLYLFGTQIGSFGIDSALTKYIAQYRENIKKQKEFLSLGIILSFFAGVIICIFLYSFSSIISMNLFHNSEMIELLIIMSPCLPFISIQKAVIGILNGMRRMKSLALYTIFQNLLIVFMSLIFVTYLDMGIEGSILGITIPNIIIGLLSLYFIRKFFDKDIILDKKLISEFKEIFIFGFYILLTNSVGMINSYVDTLMIGHFMDEVYVGYYATAVIFIQGILLIPSSIQRITFPIMSMYYEKEEYQEIKALIKSSMLKTFLVIVPITCTLAIFGKLIITSLFNETFLPAYRPMIILLAGYSICAPIGSVGAALASIGKVNVSFRLNIFCLFINAILNFILIPKFGINGAAVATSLSLINTFIVHLHLLQKYIFKKNNDSKNIS